MRTLSYLTLAAGLIATSGGAARAAVFLTEDFNNKTTQDLVDLGWIFAKNEFAKETGTDFGIASYPFEPGNFPSGKRPGADFTDPVSLLTYYGPPMANGIASALTEEE